MKEGWETKELCDCLSYIKNGANIKQAKGASGIPITRIETLSGGEFHRDRLGYADIFDPEKFESYILDDADILMSHINSKAFIGRSVIYHKQGNEQIIHGMNLLRLKFYTNLIYPEFANYYFKCAYFRNEVAKIRKDAVNQSSMAISDLKKISIPTPPISEQQHIVEELDLLSFIIEKKKAQLNELDNLAQSLFYEMFGESSNWECKQLKEITTKMGSGATPRGGNQSYKEDGVSLIRSLNVHNGHFKYDDLAHIDEQQASQLDNVTIKENDVLLNITGASVARCCIVPTDILPARVNQHVSILRVKETLLNSTYLCHCLISPNSQAELLIMSKSNAATREALPKATLEKYLVPIPPLDLQNQFAEKVQAIEHQKELIEKSIKEVETLFNSRMDYYFN